MAPATASSILRVRHQKKPMAMQLMKPEMPAGNNMSDAKRLNAWSPEDGTKPGARPSRSNQFQKPAQASARKLKQSTAASAARDGVQNNQTAAPMAAIIISQNIKAKSIQDRSASEPPIIYCGLEECNPNPTRIPPLTNRGFRLITVVGLFLTIQKML
jgi:hypothetical protein